MHSVKNRFLMRIKNISPDLYRRNWFSITARDLMVVMCCLLWEHTRSRPSGSWRGTCGGVLAKRRVIQSRRRVDDEYMASWFHYAPVSKQAPKKMARLLSRSEAAKTRQCVADAHRPPRHARHSRQLRRLRDLRRRAFHAPGGARARGHGLLPRALPEPHLPRRAPAVSAHHPPQVLRHPRAHLRLHPAPAGAPRGRGALLQRRQRHLHPVAAPGRHAGGAQRGRHRAQAQEVEPAGARPGTWSRNGWPRSARPRWSPTRAPFERLLPRALRQSEHLHPLRRRDREGRRHGGAGAAGPGARPLFPLRQPHGAGEPPARSAPGVRAGATRR